MPTMNPRFLSNLILFAVIAFPSVGEPQSDPEAGSIALVGAFIDALNTADIDATLALFTSDATLFGPFPDAPRRVEGKGEIRRIFEPLFSLVRESGDGPTYMNLVPRDIHIQINSDTAVVSFHLGIIPDAPRDRSYSFSRRTLVLNRSGAGWLIAHMHASNVHIPGAGDEGHSQNQ